MLFASGNEIQWNKDGSRESCVVIIVLVTISLQFLYLHNENKDNVSIGEMVRLYKGWEVFLNRPQINEYLHY